MKAVSWNCRGLGSKKKEEAMKDLLHISTPQILLVQETKMEEAAILQDGKKFWKKGPRMANNSRGASGGIATFWDTNLYHLEAKARELHWVFTKTYPQSLWAFCKSFQSLCSCLTIEKKKTAGIS